MTAKVHLIIAGSREFPQDVAVRYLATVDPAVITEVVSGACRGPDTWGEEWAESVGIPIKRMEPDWDGLGRRAGFVRNVQMLEYAQSAGVPGLLAFWDGSSRGTKHTIDSAKRMGIRARVILPNGKRWTGAYR